MSYLLFAWLASITYAVEVIVSKLASRYLVANPWLFNFFWSLIILIFTLPLALYNQVGLPQVWLNLVLAGFFYAASGVFFVLALYRLDVSVMSPLFNFRSVFSVLAGVLFLGEVLSNFQMALVILIFLSGVFVTLDERWSLASFARLGVFFLIIDTIFLALMGLFIKKAVAENGFWEVTLFMPALAQVFLLPTLFLFFREVSQMSLKNLTAISFIALLGVLGTVSASLALAVNLSFSSVIISLPLSMLIAFFLSSFAPQLLEKHSSKVYFVRFVAAAVMITVAVRLSLG